MALIKCPECGREISDTASACPGCGAPVRKPGWVLFISKDRAQCSSALLSMA
ncbi:MAG: zinc-ribbon domain-containing protein [Oscillospiraceae bacterium]